MDEPIQGGLGVPEDQVVAALQKGSYVSAADLKAAQAYAKQNNSSVANYLLREQIISPDILGQAIAEHFSLPYADLNTNPPTKDQVLKIPEKVAMRYRVVLFREKKDGVVVTTDKPLQQNIASQLQKVFAKVQTITLAYSLPQDIDEVLRTYRKSLDTRFSKIVSQGTRVAPELVQEVIDDALTLQASDIHFEPRREDVVVRFRVDDVLQEAGKIPKQVYENIVNRIKVMAHLRTDEHFAAQDGAIRYAYKDKAIDLRVSIAPVVDGEKVAIRLLSHYVQDFTLSNLGLSEAHQSTLQQASHLPFGMILVTGPTGSGKTTTLYSILKILNRPEVNITTIEDPVEYKINGVNHIQVNTQTELTFAKGLRSIVRQDPDIILVGEIRDEETAEIAVNAALTGHLLLSTFHANDAATAIPRLLDMEIEPFLLASTLETIVAQRLVRKICETCRASIPISEAIAKEQVQRVQQHFANTKTLYHGKGCNVCNGTGYDGRVAIFEIITVTPQMEELVMQHPSAQDVAQLARTQGSASMFEDGVEKVKQGVTTVEELLRVAQPPNPKT